MTPKSKGPFEIREIFIENMCKPGAKWRGSYKKIAVKHKLDIFAQIGIIWRLLRKYFCLDDFHRNEISRT